MADESIGGDREIISWEYLDRPNYSRGPVWHAVMVIVGISLLTYAVYSANFLFALIVIMFGLVIYVTSTVRPRPSRFSVTEDGIAIGDDFYRFREVDRFWFFYEPPVKSLYIHLKDGGFSSRIRVDLEDQDPNSVRNVLGQFVREDLKEIDEPISDTVSRILKI
ncbi:hypothetical protein JW899_04025 [Candidatus Uhrbacteria bacterium]|nr:hypothetical protein [Candidatus Uhrbacteria bacterium]